MSEATRNKAIIIPAHKPVDFYGPSFQEQLRERARNAPWLLISIGLHLIAGLILANVGWMTLRSEEGQVIVAGIEPEELETLLEEELEKEFEEEIEKIQEIDDDPEVTDEMTHELIEEEILCEEESPIDSPIDAELVKVVIGPGGGVGSKFIDKYGNRGRKKCTRATALAIEMGLEWLKRHQEPGGFWDCDDFYYQCLDKPCAGKGMALNDPGITGLALLAFLGAGSTPTQGPYSKIVRRGVKYLCDIQDPEDGCLTGKEHDQYMYNHAIACLALTEAYGLSRWVRLKKHAKRAIEFIHNTKNAGMAWRYNTGETDPKEQNDVSVTGWMIMCLASAKDFDLPYYREDIEDALRYIDEMTDPNTGRTGYNEKGSFSSRKRGDHEIWPAEEVEAMTAVAMLSRVFCGNILGDLEAQSERLHQGAGLLIDKPPRWNFDADTVDYYYWYYGSYAMFQMGGKYWNLWKDRLIKALVANQCHDGCAKGSWPPQVDPWGDDGGRIYSTALCILSLEAFYRYDNILGAR